MLAHDLRASLRSLRRRPFHTLVAVCTLAAGLATSTAVVTCISGLQQTIPGIVDSGELVQILSVGEDFVSFADYLDYAEAADAFASLAVAQHAFPGSMRLGDTTYHIVGQMVSGNYFSTLGVAMGMGRGLTAEDDRPGAPPVAVLSHHAWRQHFGAAEEILGRVIHLSGNPFTVVGVAAPSFMGSLSSIRPEVWVPVAQWPLINVGWGRVLEDRDYQYFLPYGWLRPGISLTQAQAAITAVTARLEAAHPRPEGARQVRVAAATWVRPEVRRSVMPLAHLMLAATALLLLLACANVANLLHAIAAERRREMALRAALGASPLRLVRLLLTENLLLALAAGGLGLALAGPVGERIVSHLSPASDQAYQAPPVVQVDWKIFAFALGASALAGVAAGLLPALRASRRSLVRALKGASGRPAVGRWGMGRDLLVSVQVALSVVLLVVAGLALRSLRHTLHIDPGFATEHLVTATVSIYAKEKEEGIRFYQDLVDQLAAKPWVRAASMTPLRPLSGAEYSSRIRLEGQEEPVRVYRSAVAPGYLDTLGLQLMTGRDLSWTDTADQPGVVLINEAFKERFFADRVALGRRLWLVDGSDQSFEIVGIVRDAKFLDLLTDPEPLIYCSFHQFGYSKRNALLVRTEMTPKAALPALAAALRGIDSDLAVIDTLGYDEVIRGSLRYPLMSAEVFSAVGSLGLLLAAAGVFAVMSLAVSRRTREIGIRRAVGARRWDVFGMVIRLAAKAVLWGLGAGLAAALVATRFVRSLVYGIATTDLLSFVAAASILVVVSFLAAAWPAARATRVDPMTALRAE